MKVAFLALLLAAACAVAVAQAPTAGPPSARAATSRAEIAPSGTPASTVDLMTTDGVALFGGRWRAMDARIVEATPRPNAGAWKVSYDLQPKAGVAEYDDSSWSVSDAAAIGRIACAGAAYS